MAGASDAEVLAGEAAAHDIDALGAHSNVSDIQISPCLGPVAREHLPPERIALRLPLHRPEAGGLEPQLQAADAAKQAPDRQPWLDVARKAHRSLPRRARTAGASVRRTAPPGAACVAHISRRSCPSLLIATSRRGNSHFFSSHLDAPARLAWGLGSSSSSQPATADRSIRARSSRAARSAPTRLANHAVRDRPTPPV